MSKEKKQSFMGGVTVLAISTVFVKICGALYKIPLNNILGDEGVTHFMSAYNIYAFLLTLSTAGLPLALSKLISEANATGRRNQMRRCFNTAMALFVAVGAVGTLAMLLFTEQLADLMNNSMAYWPIKALGVSVICVSIMCAYRGYAQGRQNMVPTAVSQFIEALFKLLIGLPLAWYLIQMGRPLEIGAAGAIVGVSAGTVLAMLYMIVNYRRHRQPALKGADTPQGYGVILKRLLWLGIPITIGQAGMSLLNLLDQTIILGQLQGVLGLAEKEAAVAADPNYGEIICRCETVTRAEILKAIHNPLGVHTVTGIKNRTRATMGRCQGGYCETRITQMIEEELGIPETEVRYSKAGSYMFTGKVR